LSDGFLDRWQYAISPNNTLTTKLTGLLCTLITEQHGLDLTKQLYI